MAAMAAVAAGAAKGRKTGAQLAHGRRRCAVEIGARGLAARPDDLTAFLCCGHVSRLGWAAAGEAKARACRADFGRPYV